MADKAQQLRAGTATLCVKDEEAKQRGEDSPFLTRLRAEGFHRTQDSGREANPFIYINFSERVYGHGVYGCKYVATFADMGPLTVGEFWEIYAFVKKHARPREEISPKRRARKPEKTMSPEEYAQKVYERYMSCMKAYPQEKVEAYFRGEEAQKMITEDYERNTREYEDGKIQWSVYENTAGTTAYVLTLCF